jgi:hypothetical protein
VLEVKINSAVWESSATDSNAFKYTITGQLMHNKGGIKQPRGFEIIWYNAPNKMGIS